MQPKITFERRRYGKVTYTWAYAWLGGEKVQLGDPWPQRTWPKWALDEALAYALEKHQQKEPPHA